MKEPKQPKPAPGQNGIASMALEGENAFMRAKDYSLTTGRRFFIATSLPLRREYNED